MNKMDAITELVYEEDDFAFIMSGYALPQNSLMKIDPLGMKLGTQNHNIKFDDIKCHQISNG